MGIPIAKADALLEFDAGVMEGRSDDEAWFELGHAMRMWLEVGDPNYRIIDGESLIRSSGALFRVHYSTCKNWRRCIVFVNKPWRDI